MKACKWTFFVWLALAVSQVFGNTSKSVNLDRLTRLMFYVRACWLRSEAPVYVESALKCIFWSVALNVVCALSIV